MNSVAYVRACVSTAQVPSVVLRAASVVLPTGGLVMPATSVGLGSAYIVLLAADVVLPVVLHASGVVQYSRIVPSLYQLELQAACAVLPAASVSYCQPLLLYCWLLVCFTACH